MRIRHSVLILLSTIIVVFALYACAEESEPIVGKWESIQISNEGPNGLVPSDGRFTFEANDNDDAILLVFGESFVEGSWFKSDDLSKQVSAEGRFDAAVYGVTLNDSLYMAQVFEHEGIWTLVLSGVDSDVENILFVMVKQTSN